MKKAHTLVPIDDELLDMIRDAFPGETDAHALRKVLENGFEEHSERVVWLISNVVKPDGATTAVSDALKKSRRPLRPTIPARIKKRYFQLTRDLTKPQRRAVLLLLLEHINDQRDSKT